MAGLQCFCRKLLVHNTARLINRNDGLLQPNRRRHHTVFQISSPQSRIIFQKSKWLFKKDKQLIHRLASTNVNVSKGAVSDPKYGNGETANESVHLKSESGVVPSNADVVIEEQLLPPAPVGDVTEVPVLEFVSTGLKEPSFESLGLGSWWPSGLVQQALEFLHINCDLTWWQAIIAVTVTTRLILLPLNLSVRRDTVNLVNNLPAISKFQEKITEARITGDFYAAAATTQEMQNYLKNRNVNFFSFWKTIFFQAPVFISVFYALKGMSNLPVESLKTGGLFWFTDLSVPDPYYLLPVILATSTLVMLEVGAEGNPASANTHFVKWGMRGIPLIILAVSANFSACITWYWTVSNIMALGVTGAFRIPAVAQFLKIPKPIARDLLQKRSNKGFVEGFKEGFRNAKVSGQLADRELLALNEFKKAGNSAVPRTFKRNPLLENNKK